MKSTLLTLGRFQLSPQPTGKKIQPLNLVLLCYLALEGPQSKKTLEEILYSHLKNPSNSRYNALSKLRAAKLIEDRNNEVLLAKGLDLDANILSYANIDAAEDLLKKFYQGKFLDGVTVKSDKANIWIENTRNDIENKIFSQRIELFDHAIANNKNIVQLANIAEDITEHHLELLSDKEHFTLIHRPLFLARSSKLIAFKHGILDIDSEFNFAALEKDILAKASQEELKLYHQPKNKQTKDKISTKHALVVPAPVSSLLGREKDISALLELLKTKRLISLVGLGGVGKTRLALEVTARAQKKHLFKAGVAYVEMEHVHSTQFLAKLAEKLHISFDYGEALQALQNHFQDKSTLLVLDNFEQLVSEAKSVKQLLEHCPELHIIITTRQALDLAGEEHYAVEGLPFPEFDVTDYLDSNFELLAEPVSKTNEELPPLLGRDYKEDAIQLFITRRISNLRNFKATDANIVQLIRICQLVGGLPLALEMVASISRKNLATILFEMDNIGIDFYKNSYVDAKDRHKTLRYVFDYTWQELSNFEREVLMQISLFEDGFTEKAGQRIVSNFDNYIDILIKKSFVSYDFEKNRYRQHPLIHTYSREKLLQHSDTYAEVSTQHAEYYLEELRKIIDGTPEEREQSMFVLTPEIANIHVAWKWVAETKDLEQIGTSCDALRFFFDTLARFREGENLFDIIEESLDKENVLHKPVLAKIYTSQGWLSNQQNKFESAQKYCRYALAVVDKDDSQTSLLALTTLGTIYDYLGYFNKALVKRKKALETAPKNTGFQAMANLNLANCYARTGSYNDSENNYREAYRIFKKENKNKSLAQTALAYGDMLTKVNQLEKADHFLDEALSLAKLYKNSFVETRSYYFLGRLELAKSNTDVAIFNVQRTIATAQQENRKALEADALNLYVEIMLKTLSIDESKIRPVLLKSLELQEKLQRTPEILGTFVTLLKYCLYINQEKIARLLLKFLRHDEQQQKMLYYDKVRLETLLKKTQNNKNFDINYSLDSNESLSLKVVTKILKENLGNNRIYSKEEIIKTFEIE